MGFIYKVTSPSGKHYIGQTQQTVELRWKQHIDAAHRTYKDHCKVLNKAIRKYGHKNFDVEVLEECDSQHLDALEVEWIGKYNCLTPNGMNIKSCDYSGKHNDDSKDKISKSLLGRDTKLKLSNTTNLDLPMYIIRCPKGYRVCNHPMGPEKRFISTTKSDEYNLQRALKYLETLNKLTEPVATCRTLEKYVKNHRNGYRVKFPGEKAKYFVSKTIPNEELYEKATIYLEQLKSKSAVQRLNVSG